LLKATSMVELEVPNPSSKDGSLYDEARNFTGFKYHGADAFLEEAFFFAPALCSQFLLGFDSYYAQHVLSGIWNQGYHSLAMMPMFNVPCRITLDGMVPDKTTPVVIAAVAPPAVLRFTSSHREVSFQLGENNCIVATLGASFYLQSGAIKMVCLTDVSSHSASEMVAAWTVAVEQFLIDPRFIHCDALTSAVRALPRIVDTIDTFILWRPHRVPYVALAPQVLFGAPKESSSSQNVTLQESARQVMWRAERETIMRRLKMCLTRAIYVKDYSSEVFQRARVQDIIDDCRKAESWKNNRDFGAVVQRLHSVLVSNYEGVSVLQAE